VAVGFMWTRAAIVARARLGNTGDDEDGFYRAKLDTAAFYLHRVLPQANAHFAALAAGKGSLTALPAEAF
jgi:hypothetical protein